MSEGNKLLLVDFSKADQSPWIRECELLRESKEAYFLQYETDSGAREQWFLKESVKIVEEIGRVRFAGSIFGVGILIKKYY